MKRFLLTTHCLLLTALTGCAYARLHGATAAPRALPAETAAYYDYPDHAPQATVTPVSDHRAFREFLVQFPLSVPAGFEPTEPVVEVEWFESKVPGRRPAVLFNPILGGDYPLERGVCRYLAARGFHAAMVHRKTLKISPEHEVARLEVLLRQGILRIRQTVDWMAAQERVDPERLGSFGISMGGIAGIMAAAVEPRLKAHVVALAGGSIPDVMMSSHDTLLTKPLARYMARNNMDRATLERLVRQHVRTDPIALAPYVDRTRLLMFIAVADRTIGRANAMRLWDALGRPRAVFMLTGHYTALLSLPYLKHAGWRFLEEQL